MNIEDIVDTFREVEFENNTCEKVVEQKRATNQFFQNGNNGWPADICLAGLRKEEMRLMHQAARNAACCRTFPKANFGLLPGTTREPFPQSLTEVPKSRRAVLAAAVVS